MLMPRCCGSGSKPRLLLLLVVVVLVVVSVAESNKGDPYNLRISCGARYDTRTPSSTTLWSRDFGYTGGKIADAARTSFIVPPLPTLRYFPLSEGSKNCYSVNYIRRGRYQVRFFFAVIKADNDMTGSKIQKVEPLFDISIEGTPIYSMKPGWSSDDDQAFVEAIVFIEGGSISSCFHSSGHGDPAILTVEILQMDDNAYKSDPTTILRTAKRLSCGNGKPAFDMDYNGNHWGGDRLWFPIKTFGQNSDKSISTESDIVRATVSPNFYPEQIYQSAISSTNADPNLSFQMEIEPKYNYSIWLHFSEIYPSVTTVGSRVFDVLVNGDTLFTSVDIIRMTGKTNAALVLQKTYEATGKALMITLRPKNGSHAIINAIEIFQIIPMESKTIREEVKALQNLKKALGLPLRIGWNGDPCVPQQYPWTGVDCEYNHKTKSWVIDGIGLNNQALRGVLPNSLFKLRHLLKLNLSGNDIQGAIPYSLGIISTLEVLDLSYNKLNGSIPESFGRLTKLKILNLNENSLSGKVPASLGARLLHRASFNFTDNTGLCGIPGLPSCGPHLSIGAKIGIVIAAVAALFLIIICVICCWKRNQNIARVQKMTATSHAPYAKARTHFNRDVQMTTSKQKQKHQQHLHQHHGYNQPRSPEREPRLLP